MVEKARRSKGAQRRGTPVPEWEVFVRESESDPLRHVGSVAAPDTEAAHGRASELFGWCATDCWLCPADAVERYSTRTLAESVDGGFGTRTSEETDGTPGVNES